MKAAIDIGTNTVLLLVAESRDSRLKILHEEQRIPRLGQGVDSSGYLSLEAMERVINVLNEYKEILAQKFPAVQDVSLTATSAVRDAKNRAEFLKQIQQETGFIVNMLSGLEEAQYTYWGAKSMLNDELLSRNNVVIDIGGGSTEIVWGRGQGIQDRYSFDMGCVRFTERYLKSDPPTSGEVKNCRKVIKEMLKEYGLNIGSDASLIGVAGTVTSLAYIDKQMDKYQSESLADHIISKEELEGYLQQLQQLSSNELLKRYPVVMEGRADIFIAGLLILHQAMAMYEFSELVVSSGGIRHGAILKMIDK